MRKAARARSGLDELTFGTFNVRTAAVNGANRIDHIDTLLRPCLCCKVFVTLSGCRRPNGTEHPKSWHLVAASISALIAAGSKGGKKQHGIGLAIKEEIA